MSIASVSLASVDVDVEMADAWKYVEIGRSEHRHDVYVLCPVLDQNERRPRPIPGDMGDPR